MRLTILGGGGFRTPLVVGAVLAHRDLHVDEVRLHDVDQGRLDAVGQVLAEQVAGLPDAPRLSSGTALDAALEGADVVFSAIRVGGLEGRTADERVALDLGLLGQETTGAGGLAYALRTVPVARHVAERVAAVAPGAWVVNFTNPAGLVTEAMQAVLGDRVVGICDSPLGAARRVASAAGVDLADVTLDYAGLNHLGWLRGVHHDGRDLLAELLDDDAALAATEEGQLFGVEWLRTLGALPNEYLYYYYFTRDAVAAVTAAPQTRGEYLVEQQRTFYASLAGRRDGAWQAWEAVRRERNATYMREARDAESERHEEDVAGGGYEGVAVALMAAVTGGAPATLVLNVRGGSILPGLPADAVVEVPCRVDADGPRPLPVAPLTGHPLGLVQQVKAVERLAIEAALTGSERLAVEALALHPLVDSVTVARDLLRGYRARIPLVDAVFRR